MAAALLEAALDRRGIDVRVRSAGLRAYPGAPATDLAVAVLAEAGIDIGGHRSRALAPEDLESADVVVTMTRAQLRTVAIHATDLFPRLYTLKELARRAREGEPRRNEGVRDWAQRVGRARHLADVVRDDPADDIRDPVGEPIEVFRGVCAEIVLAIADIVDAAWPVPND